MNKTAICFMSKDRCELSRRTIEPLLHQRDKFDLWWMDGSTTPEGEKLPDYYAADYVRHNVRGGPDAAVAYAVTECLNRGYLYVGIVENDVLLGDDWFARTMALFDRGLDDGLHVGAASARCYEDRVLFQRGGYNVVHNLGFGMVIWTHEAARLMLKHMRTSWTMENRRVFMHLAGVDIGHYWAFGLGEHWLCADWGVDRVLAAHGLASVALDPSPVEMIGQDPPLERQGLTLATGRDLGRKGDFIRFVDRMADIRQGRVRPPSDPFMYQVGNGGWMAFAHQLPAFAHYEHNDKWRLKWVQGYGPFAWQATEAGAKVSLEVSGPCAFMCSGGDKGSQVRVRDRDSGYECEPVLHGPQDGNSPIFSVGIPGTVTTRMVEIEAMVPGAVLHGFTVQEPQRLDSAYVFDHSVLPPV